MLKISPVYSIRQNYEFILRNMKMQVAEQPLPNLKIDIKLGNSRLQQVS